MSYIGSTPTTQSFISGTDYFNGTGSQTAFTLSRNVASVNDVEAVVNNVVQRPNDAYTISGTTITFTSAPSAGTQNIYVRYLSTTTQSITPSQNTVSYATWDNDLRNETFAFKNRIINGDMQIDQRNAGASVTLGVGGTYTLDRYRCYSEAASKLSIQQVTDAPAGFTNSLKATSLSAYSVGTNELFGIFQNIEGFNTADLSFGTASASTVTLSFWVKSSLTGTFGGSLNNNGYTRAYPFTYTVNAANTWEQKTVTIVGDTTGTWLTNNGIGIAVIFGLGAGSGRSGTAGSWTGTSLTFSATGATSVVGTNGATFYITGVQLEKGFTATNFDVLPYGTELALCQRYFVKTNPGNEKKCGGLAGNSYNSTYGVVTMRLPVTMRAAPTVTRGGTYDTFYMAGLDEVRAATVVATTYDPQGLWWEVNGSLSAGAYQMTYNGQASISAEL